MSKDQILRKLTSRKLWLAVAAFVSGLIMAFKGDSETAETVSALILSAGGVVAYILAEGWADASAASGKTEASDKSE